MCSKGFALTKCFHPRDRPIVALQHGASGNKGAKPSFKDHLATVEGQADLHAFVQRVDARVQQDWNKLPLHLRGGALCISHKHVFHPTLDELGMHLPFQHANHAWCVAHRFGACRAFSGSRRCGAQGGASAGARRPQSRRAAEMFVAHRDLQCFDVADYQHRIELLRMYGCALDAVYAGLFKNGLMTRLLTLLAYLEHHKYASNLRPPGCENPLLFVLLRSRVKCAHAQDEGLL